MYNCNRIESLQIFYGDDTAIEKAQQDQHARAYKDAQMTNIQQA